MSSDLKSFGSLSSAFALCSDCQSGQVPMQEHWVITECTRCFLSLLNLTSTLSNVLRLRDSPLGSPQQATPLPPLEGGASSTCQVEFYAKGQKYWIS